MARKIDKIVENIRDDKIRNDMYGLDKKAFWISRGYFMKVKVEARAITMNLFRCADDVAKKYKSSKIYICI